MPNYVRARIAGGTYFFTIAILQRHRGLLTKCIADLRQAFRDVRKERPFQVDAMVVLPDHLHCIWTLPEGDSDFSTRWRLIKSRFSKRIPFEESVSVRRQRKAERGIWQRRFWEHVIRDQIDFDRHVDYIHYNPVKHGHATNVADWPHSSFHRFVRNGWLPENWAAPEDIHALEFE